MKYRALRSGFLGKGAAARRVRAGEVFRLPEGLQPGSWMEPVDSDKPEKAAAKPKSNGPSTLSEMTKELAKAPKGVESVS